MIWIIVAEGSRRAVFCFAKRFYMKFKWDRWHVASLKVITSFRLFRLRSFSSEWSSNSRVWLKSQLVFDSMFEGKERSKTRRFEWLWTFKTSLSTKKLSARNFLTILFLWLGRVFRIQIFDLDLLFQFRFLWIRNSCKTLRLHEKLFILYGDYYIRSNGGTHRGD